MNQTERRIFLIRELLRERREYEGLSVPKKEPAQRELLRGLMNVRPAEACSEEFLSVQDAYLQEMLHQKGIVDADSLPVLERSGETDLVLWQGDITRLRCDAIVNAANSGMTGCYIPGHTCIDNCIHTFAGVQLRLDCDRMMRRQGYPEPTGSAKLTGGYNLPSRYILHTVGPIVQGAVTEKEREKLADCYRSCLTLAAENGIESVAFCCISTGVFSFPNEEAAEIAVRTVRTFTENDQRIRRVIFNVFKDSDRDIYLRLLGKNKAAENRSG